jgi:hypothetical protein
MCFSVNQLLIDDGATIDIYTPLHIYIGSEAKMFNLALYSINLDLRSNVLFEATVQNVEPFINERALCIPPFDGVIVY